MSTTMSTTMTLTRPTPAAPASTAAPAVKHPPADLSYLATVSVRGELRLPAATSNATATTAAADTIQSHDATVPRSAHPAHRPPRERGG